MPLLIVLHGGGGDGRGMEKLTYGGLNLLADAEGFAVAYPDGIEKHWNDGRGGVAERAAREDIPDVGFISALIDGLVSSGSVDPSRVYAAGISNGGMMSFRLACQLSEKIAAVAIVSSSMPLAWASNCGPKKPVSVLILGGTKDPLVPYEGGFVKVFRKTRGEVIGVMRAAEIWAGLNGCRGPRNRDLADPNPGDSLSIKQYAWDSGREDSEVILYEIQGGGHTWPGGRQYLPEFIVGKTCFDLDANREIWNFFKRHHR